jgi:hypothetical protein
MESFDNDLDRPVWGASAIAGIIGRSERQVFHLLRLGVLPARKCGHCWVTTKRRLLSVVLDGAPLNGDA